MTFAKLSVALPSILCGGLLVCMVGCGSKGIPKYPVSGTVTLDGAPLAEGQMFLIDPAELLDSDVGPILNGKFAFEAKAGPKRVELRSAKPTGQMSHFGVAVTEEGLAAKYNSKSTLKVEVSKSGSANVYDFPLVTK